MSDMGLMVLLAMRSIVQWRRVFIFSPFANGLANARPARAGRAPHHEEFLHE
jgi:hypothetical protein